MTRSEAKRMIPFIEAYASGETIQVFQTVGDKWMDIKEPNFNGSPENYRVKPKKTTVPYENLKEFLEAQKKHGPYISNGELHILPTTVNNLGVKLFYPKSDTLYSFSEILDHFKWQDDTPCGKTTPYPYLYQ